MVHLSKLSIMTEFEILNKITQLSSRYYDPEVSVLLTKRPELCERLVSLIQKIIDEGDSAPVDAVSTFSEMRDKIKQVIKKHGDAGEGSKILVEDESIDNLKEVRDYLLCNGALVSKKINRDYWALKRSIKTLKKLKNKRSL